MTSFMLRKMLWCCRSDSWSTHETDWKSRETMSKLKSVESVVGLASDLRLSEDVVRVEQHCRCIVGVTGSRTNELVGRDSRQNMCKRLVPLARSRLRALFRVCLSSAKHSSILFTDSSVSKKIMRRFISKKRGHEKITLQMTCSLLRRLFRIERWWMGHWHDTRCKRCWKLYLSVLDTSRRRPRTGTKMFKRKTKKKKKNTEKQKSTVVCLILMMGGDWVLSVWEEESTKKRNDNYGIKWQAHLFSK